MRPKLFYGWYDPEAGTFRLSRRPPDAPTRPVFAESKRKLDLIEIAEKKRAEILWWPPLPNRLQLSL